MQIYVGYSGHSGMAQWLEQSTADQQVPGSIWLEIMVYVHDVVKQSDHSDDQYYEPNHNVNQNDYKKFS